MKTLVIYDSTGRIWNIVYGEETIPEGLEKSALIVDIPSDMRILSVDLTDPSNPKPVLDAQPDTQIGRLQNQVDKNKESVDEDITNLQLALTEIYELVMKGTVQ